MVAGLLLVKPEGNDTRRVHPQGVRKPTRAEQDQPSAQNPNEPNDPNDLCPRVFRTVFPLKEGRLEREPVADEMVALRHGSK